MIDNEPIKRLHRPVHDFLEVVQRARRVTCPNSAEIAELVHDSLPLKTICVHERQEPVILMAIDELTSKLPEGDDVNLMNLNFYGTEVLRITADIKRIALQNCEMCNLANCKSRKEK